MKMLTLTQTKIILSVGLIALAYNACLLQGFRSATGNGSFSSGNQSPGLTGVQAFKKFVYDPITRPRCAACHDTIQAPFHASSDINTAYVAAKSRVTWTNTPSSKLIMKTTDGHCGAACQTNGSEMANAINLWKTYEKLDTPSTGGSASDSVLRSASRKFVATKLNGVFGGSANAHTDALITNDAGRFGGPCDLYARDFNGTENFGNCNLPSDSQASLIGPQTPARQSLVVRVCQRILQNDGAVTTAVTTGVGSNVTNRAPNQGDIQALYELFYTGRVASAGTLAALTTVGTTANQKGLGIMGQWRFILLALCQSPDWQIP